MCERNECLIEEDAHLAKEARVKKKRAATLKKNSAKCPLLCGSILYQSEKNLYFFFCKKCVRYFLLQPRPHSEEQALKWMHNIKARLARAIKRVKK